MELEGWNSIPAGAGAVFDTGAAPVWLRVLFHLPFLDRFAYPLMVARGCGFLSVDDPAIFDSDAATAKGWRILPEDYVSPWSWAAFGPGWSTQPWHARRGVLRAQQYVGAGIVIVVLVVLSIALLIPFPLGITCVGLIVGWLVWKGTTPR